MASNERLCEIINARLEQDPVLRHGEVRVSIGTDGALVVYWARRPTRQQLWRYRRIVRQSRRQLEREEVPPEQSIWQRLLGSVLHSNGEMSTKAQDKEPHSVALPERSFRRSRYLAFWQHVVASDVFDEAGPEDKPEHDQDAESSGPEDTPAAE